MDQRGKTPDKKKIPPGAWMFVLCYTIVWNISDMKDERMYSCKKTDQRGKTPDKKKKNPGGGEIFRIRPARPWGLPSLLYNGYRVFPGVKRPGRGADPPPPQLAPGSRMSTAIPLLPFWAFMACYREKLYFKRTIILYS
jgi:hypothetical protein